MNTLNKDDIVAGLQADVGLTRTVAKVVVDQVFEEIRMSLAAGHSVSISGFGKWTVRPKKARLGRNPKTGASTLIQERRVALFKPGDKLKMKLQQYSEGYGFLVPQSPL